MALDGLAAGAVHRKQDAAPGNGERGRLACNRRRPRRRTDREGAVGNTRGRVCSPLPNEMQPGIAGFLSVGDAPKLAAVFEFAGVADLAAHFGVEGRGVENNGGLVLHADDFEHLGGRLQLVVADELGGRGGLDLGEFDDLLLLRGAGAGLLLFHELVEAGDINGQAALAGHQLSEVEGKAVGVVEQERKASGNLLNNGSLARTRICDCWNLRERSVLVEQFNPPIQRLIKRLLFPLDDLLDMVLLGAEFGEDVAHGFSQDGHQLIEERFVEAQGAAISDGAAEYAAQDIVAVRVAGLDAVGNGEAERADVVGYHPKRNVYALLLRPCTGSARALACCRLRPRRRPSGNWRGRRLRHTRVRVLPRSRLSLLRRTVRGPQPRVILCEWNHARIPRVAANIVEHLFQIRLAANHSIQGLFFPDYSFCSRFFVDVVCGGGLNALQDVAQRPEDGLSLLVLPSDLRLEEKVNVVRHYASGVELVLVVPVSIQHAGKNDVPL